ncbi:hypothetical protein SteCoe_4761 [Stentor coeruleus]|uniref:Major facilitator superfamily (MFS) profile domain-containing protein n=1 Tax=Stentor coeruleus TaxID=5963 RepID=A0A1R2CTX0_9CILI|nr:hypothetical protein SteCoe_4761 [Stentor coeruleus]
MGHISKQLAIYVCLLFCFIPYTMIATFYPKIAESKGIPYWLIGLVFSADPLAALFSSFFLSKYMIKIGRKKILLSGLFLSAFSMFILSPIEVVDKNLMLSLSFLSRIIAGMSAACVMVAGDSVFVSDYPDDVEKMVGRYEAVSGLGMIIGPLVGIVLYLESLLIELIAFGGLILLTIPGISLMLGNFRDYVVENHKMNYLELFCKPKIMLDLGVNISVMACYGFLIPNLEIHLLNMGFSHWQMSLCFALLTFSYMVFSIYTNWLFQKLDARSTIFIGFLLIALSFLMLSPWKVIFPTKLDIILASLPIMGLGQAMIYCKKYLVPIYPHMIQTSLEYGYSKDDVLVDSLSGLSNMALDAGEIIGPIISGGLISLFGFENTGTLTAFTYAAYGLVYLFGSGLFSKWISNKKTVIPIIELE